jgi:hypothetical protein
MGYADMGGWPWRASFVHKQSAAATKTDGRRAVIRSICLGTRRVGHSYAAFVRLLGWAQTPVVSILRLTGISSSRARQQGARHDRSVIVRAGDADNGSLWEISAMNLTVRISSGVSIASRMGKEVEG